MLCCKEALHCKVPRDNARALVCPHSEALSPLTMPPPSPHIQHQTFLQHPTSTKPGAECMGKELGECQGEVLLSALSHHLANAAPCPWSSPESQCQCPCPFILPILPRQQVLLLLLLPWDLCRQLPSLCSSLTPLLTSRSRHHQQLLFPPIPSPSLP